jgi:uncharacterized protein YcfL
MIVEIMMKKVILLVMIVTLFALAACQGSSSAAQTVENAQAVLESTPVAPTIAPSEPTVASTTTLEAYQLLFGILKLQNTNQVITAEQAAVLLPLWTNYQSLTANMDPDQNPGSNTDQSAATPEAPQVDSETQIQIKEILVQIQVVMTADQVSAIESLQITQDSVQTIMTELGIALQTPGQNADGSQPQGGGGPGGGSTPPDGTPPDGGGQPPANGGNAPIAEGTPFADGGNQPGGGSRLNVEAITALINYLLSLTNAQ